MSLRRRTSRRITPFLALSLVANVPLVALIFFWFNGEGDSIAAVASEGRPIDITMIEPTALDPFAPQRTEEELNQEAEKKAEEARKEEEKPDETGQVVDSAKPAVEIRPDNAKYLGQYDTKTEHETKAPPAQKPGEGRPRAVATLTRPPQPARPKVEEVPEKAPRPASQGQNGEGGDKALAMRSAKPIEPSAERGSEQGFERTASGTEAPRGSPASGSEKGGAPGEAHSAEPGQEGHKGSEGTEEVPNLKPSDLMPSAQTLARVAAGGNDDYLKDVDDGEETLLNTKRYKYWSFFDRLKKSVASKWRPDMAYRLRDPTGQIYGFKNRLTVLKVTLKPDGSMSFLSIEKPSGVDFLDDEAVNALNGAAPFANPPSGLVDPESHLITFRFGFMFEVGGAPRFRVYRN